MNIPLLLAVLGITCVACVPVDPAVQERLKAFFAKINAAKIAEQVTETKNETETAIGQGSVVSGGEANQNKQHVKHTNRAYTPEPRQYQSRAYGFPATFGAPNNNFNNQPSYNQGYSNREYVNLDGTPYNGFSTVPTDVTGGVATSTGYPSNYWATYGSSPYGYNPYGSPYGYNPYGSPYGSPYGPYGYGGGSHGRRSHGGHSKHHW